MRFGAVLGVLLVVFAAIGFANDIGAAVWAPLALLGVALVALGILSNLEWAKELVQERQALYGANVITMVALAVLVLGIVNYMAGRHYDRSDNTEKKLHALSKKTVEELKKVERPVTATLILSGRGWNLASEHMEDTIEEFGRHCRNIGLTKIEYSEETQPQVQALSEQLKIEFDGERLPLAVFSSSTNVKQVNPDDVVQQEPMNPMMMQYGMRPPPPKLIGERCFLDAVLTVAEDKKVTLYFSVGNGERHPEKFDDQDLGEFAKLLKRANYLVRTVNLEEADTIPSDCDVLVLAAPTKTYSQRALGIVREHLRNQKGLLVLAEPEFMTGTTSGLDDLLMEYNVKLDERTVVVDMVKRVALTRQGLAVRSEPDVTVEVSEFGPHQTTRELEGESAFFMQACEVSAIDEPGAGPEYEQYPGAPPRSKWNKSSVVKSRSDDGWIDRNAVHGEETIKYDEGTDSKGKASIGVLVEPNVAPQRPPNPYMPPPPPQEQSKGPDLAVFGDADFASNALIRQVPGNEKLLMNVVRWLGKQEPRKFDDINPKEIDVRPIQPDMKRLQENYCLSLFGLPGLCLLFALGVYVLRRR
jgi:hypothetical protein